MVYSGIPLMTVFSCFLFTGVLWNGLDPIQGSCETVKTLREMVFYKCTGFEALKISAHI